MARSPRRGVHFLSWDGREKCVARRGWETINVPERGMWCNTIGPQRLVEHCSTRQGVPCEGSGSRTRRGGGAAFSGYYINRVVGGCCVGDSPRRDGRMAF